MKNAQESGWTQVIKLRHGQDIFLYGNRRVIDVHKTRNPQLVRLTTNKGNFLMCPNTWVSPPMKGGEL